MTVDVNAAAVALSRVLHGASDDSVARWHGARDFEDFPVWAEELLSRLLTLLDGNPGLVRYATCQIEQGIGSVIAFTDRLVIVARSASTEPQQVEATAHRRSKIESIRVTESGTVLDRGPTSWQPDWPGKIGVEVTLSTLPEPLVLPLVANVRPDNNAALINLTRELLNDLMGAQQSEST